MKTFLKWLAASGITIVCVLIFYFSATDYIKGIPILIWMIIVCVCVGVG